jgi:hypothetical protein
VSAPEVGVEAVLAVAGAVVGQAHDLVGGVVGPVAAPAAAFVEVVAEVQDGVEVVALGDGGVGVEVAGRVVRAGDDGEAEPVDGTVGRRLGAADERTGAEGLEPVEVPATGLQAPHVDLDREVTGGRGIGGAGGDDIGELDVGGDGPRHRDRPHVRRGDPGPEHDAVGERIARCHAVQERGQGGVGLGLGEVPHDGAEAHAGAGQAGDARPAQERPAIDGAARHPPEPSQRRSGAVQSLRTSST